MSAFPSQAKNETRLPAAVPGWRWLWPSPAPSRLRAADEPARSQSRPRRMRRTGRAVVLWSLGWYVVAQLAVRFFTEQWRSALSATEIRKWPQLRRLVAATPDRPLVLMLGSSRTAWALRAGRLDGMAGPDGRPLLVYNFGIPTAGPIHQRMYLRDLLAQGIRPRLLLVEFTLPLLCQAHRGCYTEESMTKGAWTALHQLRELTPYFEHPSRPFCAWLEARIAPWYAFRGDIHECMRYFYEGKERESILPPDAHGWHPVSKEPPSAEERASTWWLARTMYAPGLGRFRLGTGPLQALHEVLEISRRERIQVALIVMPESSPFRGLYAAEATAALKGVLKELRARHRIPVIDARRWVADRDFVDTHHVALSGAELFTTRLRGEIQRLLAQQACSSADGLRE